MRLDIADFPIDCEGNIIAQSWFISVRHTAVWLTKVAKERGFQPRKNPYEMTPNETQRAVANTICPRRYWASGGIAVNYEQTKKMTGICQVVLYYTHPVNWWDVKYVLHGAHFEPSLSSVYDLNRFLERGGRRSDVICPIWRQGTPIGDNVALVEREKARREEERRIKEELEAKRRINLTLTEKLVDDWLGRNGNYTTEVLYRRENSWQGEEQPSIPT